MANPWIVKYYCLNCRQMVDNVFYSDYSIWECADGTYVKIIDMTTRHIKNCIKTITNHESIINRPYLEVFQKELKRRGVE